MSGTSANRSIKLAALLLAGGTLFFASAAQATTYLEMNLITDDSAFLAGQGYSPTSQPDDPKLVNPWGISHSATSPFWVSDNGTGISTLYNGAGVKNALEVNIPPTDTTLNPPVFSTPTGQVFNANSGVGSTDFLIPKPGGGNFGSANFIFATEDGTIAARSGTSVNAVATTAGRGAVIVADNTATAIYKGLAIGTVSGAQFLYAANFKAGTVDVFDHNFAPTALAGTFTDPGIPAGYAPFNVQTLNGKLYVTYALRDSTTFDDISGAGHGFVDEYNLDGTFQQRIATQGLLDSPWGLDIAPGGFGQYANDLLVGNFGDGRINVYDPNGGGLLGTLIGNSGNPLEIDGLWALSNGTGTNSNANAVYFTAGIGDEAHGLFGALLIPEPATLTLLAAGLAGLAGMGARRRKQAIS